MKNPAGKFRDVSKGEQPYLTVVDEHNAFGPTTFQVVKFYTMDPAKPYARVMVLAVSGATGPSGDYGDAYWGDVTGTITQRDPVITDAMIPSHLRGGPMQATTLDSVMDDLMPRPTWPERPEDCRHMSVQFSGLTQPTGICQMCGSTVRHATPAERPTSPSMWVIVG